MILTCPSCGTQYVVKDGAIPPGGRQVRCASCKHSWHQDAEDVELTPAMEPHPESQLAPNEIEPEAPILASSPDSSEAEDDEDESIAEATLIEPRSGPEAEERAYEEAMIEEEAPEAGPEPTSVHAGPDSVQEFTKPTAIASTDWNAPPEAEATDDEFSPFAAPDGSEPRRSPRPIVTILLIIVVIAALAAAFWFLAPPEWKARVGLGTAGVSPLALVTTHMDRQQLESGNELLTVTGRVINPTASAQDVPPLHAQLKSKTGKVVYSWTIQPPTPSLAAGSSASFNSAEVSVPPGGDELTITLGSPRA